jgi:PPK2 family polyphosphate:nucleotide phosphotransferase
MSSNHDLPAQFRVKPDTRIRLHDYDPGWTGKHESKEDAEELIAHNLQRLTDVQDLLWASERYAVLIVLQAMDTAGKDGLIKHVMSGVNPQSCQVFSFKQPSAEELEHDFLWRYTKCLPARGRIGIFNRSYYEEVLVVRVHPEWLEKQRLPHPEPGRALWQDRYQDINHFEKHLVRNGTVILKFFLHLSKKEQKERLLARLDNPKKHWKFSEADLAERAHWQEYVQAYEDALSATSTGPAPWYIIPADHKWVSRWLVSEILATTIEELDLKMPPPAKEQQAALEKARRMLEQE